MKSSEITRIIKKALSKDVQYAKYGNGSKAAYRRFIENDMEYTLIGNDQEPKMLYVGTVGATVSRLKEGRREDNLVINGETVKWASLCAKNITSENDYFKCC